MTPFREVRIAEIRERLDKASPRPWVSLFGSARHNDRDEPFVLTSDDATMIVHAPDDLAFLLDLLAPVAGEVETPTPLTEPEVLVLLDQIAGWKAMATKLRDQRDALGLKVRDLTGQVRQLKAEEADWKLIEVHAGNLNDELVRTERRVDELEAENERLRASGEVETPCATCGGSGTDAAGISDAPCDICGGSGIAPDCGVETPEAAVAALAKLIDWHDAADDEYLSTAQLAIKHADIEAARELLADPTGNGGREMSAPAPRYLTREKQAK